MTREPNPLPYVREYLNERQQRRRCIALIRDTRQRGIGKVDMALRTAERYTEL